jgi:hypothetical protein
LPHGGKEIENKMPQLTEREIDSRISGVPADSGRPVAPPNKDDGTSQLLRAGSWTLAVGLLAAALTETVLGGITKQGPQTNLGWLALMVAMMCLPFGLMLFVLGAAKWMRNRRLQREFDRSRGKA